MGQHSTEYNPFSALKQGFNSSKRFAKKQTKKAQYEAIFGKQMAERLLSDPTQSQKEKSAHRKKTLHQKTKKTPSHLSEEDALLFKNSMAGVRPLKTDKRAVHTVNIKPPTQAILEKRALAEGRTFSEKGTSPKHFPHSPSGLFKNSYSNAIEDDLFYLRNKDQKDILSKLRKRYWPIESSVDLHGCTEESAHTRFVRFIQSCTDHYIRCVCIIHGKGINSIKGQPIIKPQVRQWLKTHPQVQAFIEAPENMGGSGAVIVLLEKRT